MFGKNTDKIFTRNYTLNKSEKLLLELMRQVPVVKTLHGEESKDFDNLIITIYNTVDYENNKKVILAMSKRSILTLLTESRFETRATCDKHIYNYKYGSSFTAYLFVLLWWVEN